MPLLPFFALNEDLIINIKQVKMFRKKEGEGWEVFFDRADVQPVSITDEQYQEIVIALVEKEEREHEDETMRRSISPEAKRMERLENTLRRMGA